jgi:hypothetical protein
VTSPGVPAYLVPCDKDSDTVTGFRISPLVWGHNGTKGDNMELHGITGKPYATPQVRRKLPAPFTRPLIDLTGGRAVKREWKDLSVVKIERGDVVAGFGTVAGKAEFINVDNTEWETDPEDREDVLVDRPVWLVRLFNVMGDYKDFPGEQRVFVFAPVRTNG